MCSRELILVCDIKSHEQILLHPIDSLTLFRVTVCDGREFCFRVQIPLSILEHRAAHFRLRTEEWMSVMALPLAIVRRRMVGTTPKNAHVKNENISGERLLS